MSDFSDLLNNLELLKLDTIKAFINDYLDANSSKSFVTSLKELTDKEISFRNERAKEINIKISNFCYQRTIDEFDFDYQPSISKNQILDLASLRFIDSMSNILFVGSPGTGKTHLAVAIGTEAASKHMSTYFIHFNDLINKIKKACQENRQENIVKHYQKYKLLIIDEIGFLPVDKEYGQVFFQLINARYEKKSTIITTNKPLSKWSDIFNDSVIATAILDRLVHHSTVIKITGPSYRIKDLIEEINNLHFLIATFLHFIVDIYT